MLDPKIAGMVLGPKVTPGQGLDACPPASLRCWLCWPTARAMPRSPPHSTSLRRAVERRINAIFTKLGLHDDGAVNRRVLAALTYVRNGA